MIFRYNTKKYNETRNDDDDDTLLGNTPFLVENKAGKIIIFGSSKGLDYYVEEYETGRWPDMPRLSDFNNLKPPSGGFL